jgi:hypothetical protein
VKIATVNINNILSNPMARLAKAEPDDWLGNLMNRDLQASPVLGLSFEIAPAQLRSPFLRRRDRDFLSHVVNCGIGSGFTGARTVSRRHPYDIEPHSSWHLWIAAIALS